MEEGRSSRQGNEIDMAQYHGSDADASSGVDPVETSLWWSLKRHVVPGQGFEPRISDSESLVMPFHYPGAGPG